LSDKTEVWIVAPENARRRLDLFLAAQMGESRSQIQNWIREGSVHVNGESAKTGYLIKPNDRIELKPPPPQIDSPQPENIPLEILYEDSDLAVVNKPAGLVCHSGAGKKSGTLVNALLFRMGPLVTGDPQRPGIVHRLDKFTSGVMLAAKNTWSHRMLSQQFKDRLIKKEYLAMVHGKPTPSSGTIDLPLGRDPVNRKKISIRARKKKSAVTHYSTVEQYGSVSLLSVRIETGRTHQIRVHLSQKGYPVVGDVLYGGNRIKNLPPDLFKAAKQMQRPFLHSRQLTFQHPRTGAMLSFVAPLPLELADFQRIAQESRQPGEKQKWDSTRP
jgi:23S rRNA pseudouridine1911/1915/1917 synthase